MKTKKNNYNINKKKKKYRKQTNQELRRSVKMVFREKKKIKIEESKYHQTNSVRGKQ